jgi:hypothetical protein
MAQRGRPKGIGKTPGSGRKRGTPNRIKSPDLKAKIAEAQQATLSRVKAVASGLTPLEYMLACVRDETMPPGFRLDAAHKAAPYVHAKCADQPSDQPVQIHEIVQVIVPSKRAPDEPVAQDEIPRQMVESCVVRAEMELETAPDPLTVARSGLDKMRGTN